MIQQLRRRVICGLCLWVAALSFSAHAQTNSWTAVGGKWETAANWSAGAPAISNAANVITNVNFEGDGIITIDATTAATPSVMTISNLMMSGVASNLHTLVLNNSGVTTPLHILNSLQLLNGGAMAIVGSALQVDGALGNDSTLTLQSNAKVTVTNAPMYIGLVATGQVAMTGGTATLRTLLVASNALSVGTFSMSSGNMVCSNASFGVGTNSTAAIWLTGGELDITNLIFSVLLGQFGNAQMTVSNGATLRTWITLVGTGGGSAGTLTVAGGNAVLGALNVGQASNSIAAAWVSNGQLITTNQGLYIADAPYSVGEMTVSNGTVLTGTQTGGTSLIVGANSWSTGTLTMDGGTLSSMGPTDNVIVAFSTGSTGSVWMNGGTVTATNGNGYLFLGLQGSGQWTLTNGSVTVANLDEGEGGSGTLTVAGGTLSVLGNTTIGYAGSSNCAVWVTGGQLLAPNGPFVLGNYGPGSMTASGGSAVVQSMIISSNNTANTSTLTISGGQVTVFNSLVVGDCASNAIGQITVNAGTLYVTNATHTGYIDFRSGTLSMSGGAIIADQIILTSTCAQVVSTGGTVTFGQAILNPNQSWVGDGIPNGWKQQYGLNLFDFNLASEDLDGSGLTILQDYLAGLDPTNPVAAFRIISLVQTGNDMLVTWTTAGGHNDVLQAAPYLGGSYSNVSPAISIAGAGAMTTNYLDAGGATNGPQRFYRVALVQPTLDHFGFSIVNGSQTSGVPFTVTITAYDATNGVLIGYSGPVSLSATSSMGTAVIWPVATTSFFGGHWTGPVTVTAPLGASVTIIAADPSGPTGQTNPFSIVYPATSYPAANVLIPVGSTPADIVSDSARKLLYMTVSNQVLRYDLVNKVFLAPFTLGGTLEGVDISPDNNTLVVANAASSGGTNWIYLVDLLTGSTQPVPVGGGSTVWDVAFGSDGAILFTTACDCDWTTLERYDPATGEITNVPSPRNFGDISGGWSMVRSSADGQTIEIAESNSTGSNLDRFDVAAQTIANPTVGLDFASDGDVNQHGTQFAGVSIGGTFLYDTNFTQLAQMPTSVGCAYNPQGDQIFLAASGTSYLRVFDTRTFTEMVHYDCGSTFPSPGYYGFQLGRTRASRDGTNVFVTVGGGVRWITFGSGLSADLALSLVGSSNPVRPGSNLTYTITITNSGPQSVTGAQVFDILPPNSTFVSANSSLGTCTLSNGVVTGTLSALANGSVATVSVVIAAPVPAVLTNLATVISSAVDPNISNNTATVVTPVQFPSPPTLTITSPTDNSYTTNSTVTVTGTSSSPLGVASVSVNGFSASSANGYSNWTAAVGGLTAGTNALVVTAADNYTPPDVATNFTYVIFATGNYDGNGDGLPDLWQLQYFGCVTCPAAAPGNDPDGDGFSNLQKYLAGTDPTNPAAAFRITSITPTGNNLLVTWTMGPNRTNALQATAGNVNGAYNTNNFSDIFTVTNTVGTTTNYLETGAATNVPARYYRVRLVP